MDHSPPGFSVHGISQARILEWVDISFSKGSFQLRDSLCISCTDRQILYHWATREALSTYIDTHELTETFWVPLLNYCCESSTIIQNFTSHKKILDLSCFLVSEISLLKRVKFFTALVGKTLNIFFAHLCFKWSFPFVHLLMGINSQKYSGGYQFYVFFSNFKLFILYWV